jgi:hypothetical protein
MTLDFFLSSEFFQKKNKKKKVLILAGVGKNQGWFLGKPQGWQPLAQPLIFNGVLDMREPAYLA